MTQSELSTLSDYTLLYIWKNIPNYSAGEMYNEKLSWDTWSYMIYNELDKRGIDKELSTIKDPLDNLWHPYSY